MSHPRCKWAALTAMLVLGLLSFDAASSSDGTTLLVRDYKGISFPYGMDWTQRVVGWQTRYKCIGGTEMAGCAFILNLNMPISPITLTTTNEVSSSVLPNDYIMDYVPYYCEERTILIVLHEILIIPPECYIAVE